MVTRASAQEEIAPGQSRIGGVPDLPETWAWPAFADKPMAFLAQLNLAEIPADVRLEPLPSTGILYVFSMLGRQTKDGDHDDDGHEGSDHPGISQILYYDQDPADSIQDTVTRPGERLLLQIDSDANAGMMWGEALEERRFSAVRSDTQCG